ncbi:hypothetical protein DICSQDRAFT_184053 [Dichomitus squalens LYAD-421 SS1]|uniref:Uncharacterized protein n=1 Tax=Dichomitus squalens (strain LYAD-421) TaxID=732165 RepID=R7SIP0_DICSQ|nr:uncharacterized protein DICSQDRAFT_184053 [Dichomitus squalens LYAD-421 SS1]EJF56014.1 hypothetical protein DICSQDRAFT_184053 [Dichomitus squalens LYAD-421 SS1]
MSALGEVIVAVKLTGPKCPPAELQKVSNQSSSSPNRRTTSPASSSQHSGSTTGPEKACTTFRTILGLTTSWKTTNTRALHAPHTARSLHARGGTLLFSSRTSPSHSGTANRSCSHSRSISPPARRRAERDLPGLGKGRGEGGQRAHAREIVRVREALEAPVLPPRPVPQEEGAAGAAEEEGEGKRFGVGVVPRGFGRG